MNKSYSLQRLSLLFRKQWIEYGRIYGVMVAILFGVLFLIYLAQIMSTSSYDEQSLSGNESRFLAYSQMSFREPVLIVSLCVYMSVMAGNYFNRYAHPAGGIQELTLPVSLGERLSIGLLTVVLLCGLTFWIVFFVVDSLFVSFLKETYQWADVGGLKMKHQDWPDAGFLLVYQTIDIRSWAIYGCISILLPSLFLLGSIYFKHFAFLKSALVVVFFFVWNITITSYLGRMLHTGMVPIVDHLNPPNEVSWIYLICFFLSLVGIWIAIFYRLKEKEV